MNKDPPYKSKREKFVDRMLYYADDDSHGYSQKPPSGRWGPDFDCSSLVYQAASDAGYDVGTGSDRVRFTGTMLKDFEKAGFQVLPFANVGLSDLRVGDILLNLALHAEVYVNDEAEESVGATESETGGYIGMPGDQTGHEIEKHPVTTFKKDWDYVLRPSDEEHYEEIEEGEEDVPMNYGPTPMSQTQSWPNPNNQQMYPQGGYNNYNRGTYPQGTMYPQGNGYPQGNTYPQGNGYPQGNLGQMNGYAQAGNQHPNGGNQQGMGYPQGMSNDLKFVMGIEGAKNCQGTPNSREAVFDEDKPIMFILHFGQNGMVDDIHAYNFSECSEDEMPPQHLSPLMKHNMGQPQNQMPMGDTGMPMTRDDLKQMIKEVIQNESANSTNQSTQSGSNDQRRNGSNNANNSNGRRNS